MKFGEGFRNTYWEAKGAAAGALLTEPRHDIVNLLVAREAYVNPSNLTVKNASLDLRLPQSMTLGYSEGFMGNMHRINHAESYAIGYQAAVVEALKGRVDSELLPENDILQLGDQMYGFVQGIGFCPPVIRRRVEDGKVIETGVTEGYQLGFAAKLSRDFGRFVDREDIPVSDKEYDTFLTGLAGDRVSVAVYEDVFQWIRLNPHYNLAYQLLLAHSQLEEYLPADLLEAKDPAPLDCIDIAKALGDHFARSEEPAVASEMVIYNNPQYSDGIIGAGIRSTLSRS
jgi:hypothetical protein